MRTLTAHLDDIRRAWRWAVVLGGAKAAVSAVVIVAVALAGEHAVRGTDTAPALWLGCVVAAAAALAIILNHLRRRLLERAALWVDHAISLDLLTNRMSTGAVASIATAASRQVGALQHGLKGSAATAAIDALCLPFIALGLTIVDWRAAVVAGIVFSLGLGLALIGAGGDASPSCDIERARSLVAADGASRHSALVRTLSLGPGVAAAWSRQRRGAVASAYARLTSAGRWRVAADLFATASLLAVGGLGLAGVQDGAINRLDAAIAFGTTCWIVYGLRAVITDAVELRAARAAWRSLVTASRAVQRNAAQATTTSGVMTIDRVGFVYHGRRGAAVEHVDLCLEPGEVVALTGPPGAGKSTLAALVAGALVPTSGSVQNGGLRIGYVAELPLLLDGTIADNVARFGRSDVKAVQAAFDRAGVGIILDACEVGMETAVRTDACQPLGGLTLREARGVMFARALYAPIDMLIVDKPELAMEGGDVQFLVAALQRLRQSGIGILLATNDLRFHALADRLVRIEAGRIVGVGVGVKAARSPGVAPVRLVHGQRYATVRQGQP